MKNILKRSTALLLALMIIISTMALTAVAQGPATGFGQENGNWYYYKNSQIDTTRNDVVQGTVNGQDGWWYVVGGQVQLGYTGVANYANQYGWWYIKNGKVDFSCNSVEENRYGWWYVVGGKVQFGYTGVANYANDYGWWYVKDGKVDFNKTGIEQNNYGWWRVINGKVDFSCNSVEQNDYGWWYLVGGKVQFGYTGVANYANAYGWWYIKDGKVDFSKTGVEQNNYGWWRVVNGKVDFSCNSVEQNDYGWWYIKDGKVDFSYTGTASNSYGTWYIENGKVDFNHGSDSNSSESTSSGSETCTHNWQAVYKTVHHDEVGHWETTNSQAYRYVCRQCGWYTLDTTGMSDSEELSYMRLHWNSEHGGSGSYTVELVDVGTTTTWVVDSTAYDEQVIDHYVCTICGATK